MLILLSLGCLYISDTDVSSMLDRDGDGVSRPADCDDDDATVGGQTTWYADGDGDGFGGSIQQQACPGEPGLVLTSGDCDDEDSAVFPGAVEACNEVDDDCDDASDEGVEVLSWYFDGDGDTYGDPDSEVVLACEGDAPEGHVSNDDDCDDDEAATNPDVDWYLDADEDGYGDPGVPLASCLQPAGFTSESLALDCDDADPAINPDAQEVCDEADLDEDCDELADDADDSVDPAGFSLWYDDSDGDGYGDAFTDPVQRCDPPQDYVGNHRDCAPMDASEEASLACNWIQMSAGYSHSCGVKGDGTGHCWGYNGNGELNVPGGAFETLEADWDWSCGLETGGALRCWGRATTPAGVDNRLDHPAGTFTSFSLVEYHGCAIAADESAACWGYDYFDTTVPPTGSFAQVLSTPSASCGLDFSGRVRCWGHDDYVKSLSADGPFTHISGDQATVCGLEPDGSLDCWGRGDEPFGRQTHPAGSDYTQVDCGYYACCALDEANQATCWGDLEFYELEPPPGDYASISVGVFHICAIDMDGEAVCWGYDGNGQASPPP